MAHRQKLRDLRFSLEKAVNEFGASCLPYPRKGSTIGDIVGWFDKEIQALPATFTKADKNFAFYAIVGVLRMLYDFGCGHTEGLQSVMASCDATILDDLSPELSKRTDHIVRKWWAEHGLPVAACRLRKEPEVSISSSSCNALRFCAVACLK